MSIPTTAPFPSLEKDDQLLSWSRLLREFFSRHLSIFSWPEQRITVATGANNNLNVKGGYLVHLVGSGGAFSVSGIGGGSPGRPLFLHNATAFVMTLQNDNAGSAVGNRIFTFGGDLTINIVELVYDHLGQHWLVTAFR